MTALWVTLAAIGVALTLIAISEALWERRRHRRIARAHEPRPFRAQD
jgi:uncharacterized membrane protein YozB (DUF420 family)